jgi:transposase-like protein
MEMNCPKCKSLDVVEYESKVACGYWCDKCDYEWLKKASLGLNKEGVLG